MGYAEMGKQAETLGAAEDTVRISNSPSAAAMAAWALAHIGESGKAKQFLTKALEQAKEHHICRFLVADAYAELGEKEGPRVHAASLRAAVDLNTLDRGGSPIEPAPERRSISGSGPPRRTSYCKPSLTVSLDSLDSTSASFSARFQAQDESRRGRSGR